MAVSRLPVKQNKKLARMTTPFREFSSYEEGRVRNLKFDVNALADFEQETGMGFAQLMKQRAVFASARAMLWAGLKHEDRALTIEDVGNLLSDYLRDEEVGEHVHSIDAILMVTIEAAVEHGALGRRKDGKPVTPEGEILEAESEAGPTEPPVALESGTTS